MTDPLTLALSAAYLGVVGLGVAVARRGVAGYRRTGSRAMLAFGVAFALISLDPVVALAGNLLLAPATTGYVLVAADVLLFGTAFSLVLYALYRLT